MWATSRSLTEIRMGWRPIELVDEFSDVGCMPKLSSSYEVDIEMHLLCFQLLDRVLVVDTRLQNEVELRIYSSCSPYHDVLETSATE
ncbi:hypothetical protein RB195_021842 [Necator americanus]|uniref:Uncharacterized protein n=1 Tax=Necator americanus TaxID=51031 RepID=A0ABR1ECV7_NECAM